MTSRLRWMRPSGTNNHHNHSREYASLVDEDTTTTTHPRQQQQQPMIIKRRVIAQQQAQPETTTWSLQGTSSHGSSSRSCTLAGGGLLQHHDELDAVFRDGAERSKDPAFCWPAFRFSSSYEEENVVQDASESDDDDDDDDNMLYMANYYGKATFPKKKVCDNNKHVTKALAPPSSPQRGRRLRFPNRSQLVQQQQQQQKLGLSQSFETQETQMEEASATSISTTTSYTDDDDVSTKAVKTIRWLDQVETQSSTSGGVQYLPLATVHPIEYSTPATCRIVILLLMDNGPEQAASNFEFLHCEFRHDDRLKVTDALQQITQLVLGTPEAPLPAAAMSQLPSFRPFTRLCYEGRELINTFALQDYHLEDGQSTLVAIRKGSENDRSVLLKQSALLLEDKRLRRGIRKARIAGRSLQILYGTQGLLELAERGGKPEKSQGDEDDDDDEPFDAVETKEEQESWSAFDNLSLSSFDNDEFGDVSFENTTTASVQATNWLDDDFFEGKEFFHTTNGGGTTKTTTKPQSLTALTITTGANNSSLGWASLDDEDDVLFPETDVSFDDNFEYFTPSPKASESVAEAQGANGRLVNV